MSRRLSSVALAAVVALGASPGLAQQGGPPQPTRLSPVMSDAEYLQMTQSQALAERITSALSVLNAPYNLDPVSGTLVAPSPEEKANMVRDTENLIQFLVAEQFASPEVTEQALMMVQARLTNALGNTFSLEAVQEAVANAREKASVVIADNAVANAEIDSGLSLDERQERDRLAETIIATLQPLLDRSADSAALAEMAQGNIQSIIALSGATPAVVERALLKAQNGLAARFGDAPVVNILQQAVQTTRTQVQASISGGTSVASNGPATTGDPGSGGRAIAGVSGGVSGGPPVGPPPSSGGGGGGGSDYRPTT
jgi:hypothetical protein